MHVPPWAFCLCPAIHNPSARKAETAREEGKARIFFCEQKEAKKLFVHWRLVSCG
jgi:hypothetical protein